MSVTRVTGEVSHRGSNRYHKRWNKKDNSDKSRRSYSSRSNHCGH
jgi:hypothetical protein